MGREPLLRRQLSMKRSALDAEPEDPASSSGISPPFGRLFRTQGQVTHALLTRSPLYRGSCDPFLVRLACVRHAASVRSEPGSNSPFKRLAPRGRLLNGQLDLVLVLLKLRSNGRTIQFSKSSFCVGCILGHLFRRCQAPERINFPLIDPASLI